MSINRNIKALLDEAGKKQLELAEWIGASKSAVNNWLKNDADVPAKFVPGIATFFGVPISRLFQGFVSAKVIHDVLVHDGDGVICPRCGFREIAEEDMSCRNCGLEFTNYCTNPECRMNSGWDDPVCFSYATCYCPECGAKTTLFENGSISEKSVEFNRKSYGMSEDEIELVEIFRELDKSGKRIVLGIAEQERRRVASKNIMDA